MTILSHNEITGKGKQTYWSVQSFDNNFMDDEYYGTFEECAKYIKDTYNRTEGGKYDEYGVQTALIDTQNGIFTYCHEVIYFNEK